MNASPSSPLVPVSWGELLDKLTILEIKRARIADAAKRANVEREYRLLRDIAAPAIEAEATGPLLAQLKAVNEALWEIEDAIRTKEAEGDFGPGFVCLARSVYRQNDERAALKRRLNLQLNSDLVEEKSYREGPVFFLGETSAGRAANNENSTPVQG
ncbi:MAG TPA: DUF6165 family protein [Allosphingosinicella sp.]|nr:DUF6165 family protein [Allosphingosinicella sp.]